MMKKVKSKALTLLTVLLLSASTLFGATLVVDNTPECSIINFMGICIGGYKDCTGGNNYKDTIQDALNDANANDTIEICSGAYEEAVTVDKDNLTLKGVDGQSPEDVLVDADSNIGITLKKSNIALENFKVKSSGNHGIYGNYYAIGKHTFKHLIIEANNRGIYLDNGSDQTFESLNITAGDIGIYTDSNVNGDHTYKNITIHSTSNAIQIDKGGKSFENLNLTSDNGRGIDVVSTSEDLTFEDISIHSKQEGILTRYNATGEKSFNNINISSEGKSIYVDGGKKATFDNIEVNSSNDMGIYLSANPIGDHVFSHIKVNSKSIALFVGKGGKDFENLELNSTNDRGLEIDNTSNDLTVKNIAIRSKKEGIYAAWNVNGGHTLSDISINSEGTGINFARGFSSLKDVNITSKDRGIDIAPYRDTTIDNVDINTSEGKESIVLRWGDGNANVSIKNSKIYGNQSYDGIYTSNGYIVVDSVCIDGAKRGIYFPWNVNAPEVTNTDIKNTTDWAVTVDADRSHPAQINNNCFSGDKLAYSNGLQHNFDGNYWDGVSDSNGDGKITHEDDTTKIHENVVDNSPKSSCEATGCGGGSSMAAPAIDYQMDECSWDNDENTYEIENSGTLDDYNATAGNDANVTEGKICRGGDINSTSDNDKYIIPKNNIDLPDEYTLNTWVKFPLNTDGHKKFTISTGWWGWSSSKNVYYLNIADAPGSNDDFIYFTYIIDDDKWQLCVKNDNSHKDCQDFDVSSLNGWKMLTFRVNGDDTETKFYLNADEKLTFSTIPSDKIGLIFNSDYGSNNNQANGQSIGAYADEFKIFNSALLDSQINDIYDNEKDKKNYDGSVRNCPECNDEEEEKNYKFDAWDVFRDINDRNISTKIVNSEFNITIASLNDAGNDYADFNGTVCVTVDNNTSRLIFLDQNSSTATFKIDKAIRDTKVHISWKKDMIENCPMVMEDNSTNSTDNFAIRPEKFGLDFNTTSFYAGANFKIDLNATDGNGLCVKDYNETEGMSFVLDKNDSNSSCISGILFKPSNLSFVDGKVVFDSNYTEVGDINLTLKEKLGSEFAKVDTDDTAKEARLIKSYSKKITFEPYRFVIADYKFERFPNQKWRYMSDVNESNITLSFVIQAQNKNGNLTKKFDKNCYSKDVQINVDTISSSSDGNVSYYLLLNGIHTRNHDKSLNDFDLNATINASSFHEANSSKIVYALNVYREFDKPKNPLDINITDINTTYISDSGVKNRGLKPDNNISSFYFGRVVTQDISTNQSTKSHSLVVAVYSDRKDTFVDGYKNYSLNWYYMTKDNFTNIKSLHPQKSFKYQAGDDLTQVTLNPNSNIVSSNGRVDFNISNSWQESGKAYIHIKVPKYLWYNKYRDYNDSNSSDCSSHPCFEYIYYIDKNSKNIKSGIFNGTSIGDEYNATKKSKTGIKVFR